MTQGPVVGLLAFWSGIHASIWIGNFPGDTFSEHLTWYSLWRGILGICRIMEEKKKKICQKVFATMMRFLTFFSVLVNLVANVSLWESVYLETVQTFRIHTKIFNFIHSRVRRSAADTRFSFPSRIYTILNVWVKFLLVWEKNIFISQIFYLAKDSFILNKIHFDDIKRIRIYYTRNHYYFDKRKLFSFFFHKKYSPPHLSSVRR